MEQQTLTVPERTPPRWVNLLVGKLLHIPGLQRWLGRGLAVLRFSGRRSGKPYEIPVSYHRRDSHVLMVTKKSRSWWRNFTDGRAVRLRLAGREYRGTAVASIGDGSRNDQLRDYLTARKFDAKAFGVRIDDDGLANAEDVARLLPLIVLIDVTLD